MIKKKVIPYYQDKLQKAFSYEFPKNERVKKVGNIESFNKTNQNEVKGLTKR